MDGDSQKIIRKIVTVLSLLVILTFIGAIGFHFTTEEDWFSSVYYAVITVTTLGYSEPAEFGTAGRMFVICYMIGGLGVFSFSAFQLGQIVVSVEFRTYRENRRKRKRIGAMKNHFLVCGCGRMGQTIAEQLQKREQEFVVIDSDLEHLKEVCEPAGWSYVVGDATDDDVLLEAGIQRARGLASVLPTDSNNVYVVLSARMLMSNLQIIARASTDKAVLKMERAGATRVVSPFSSGAQKMARFLLNPTVEDFLEIADSDGVEFELADVQIGSDSPYVGLRLNETDLREKGAMIVGIRRASGQRLMPPPGSARIEAGDCLFVFGSANSVTDMTDEEIEASEHSH